MTTAVTNAVTHAGRVVNKAIAACLIAAISGGCATARGPAQLGTTLAGASSETDWSRVRQLAPGAEIFVTLQGSQARSCQFVAADESSVIALNLGAAALPAEAGRTLRDMAAHNPERLVALRKGGAFQQGRVRIGRDGLFVDERRIAAFDDVLETLPRSGVSQIEGPVVARGRSGGACWARSLDSLSAWCPLSAAPRRAWPGCCWQDPWPPADISDITGPATRPTASCTGPFSRPTLLASAGKEM